ncbi:uncharacterized protein [Blastocystis hominis]|uniref:Small GTP-binding protein n=1 Tax=Blastocystis hominis TaxID=12968 RepID=D8M5A4_BLAHO|nr:uncharacterized protein [Blastocystis hominis]CBK23243.2 unnamed protein product [Blastocystis hominis]|eukprot:XP_012897291.1 uncharacterized protein [Blastocystis hominis]
MNSIESKIVVIGPPDVGKTCLSIRYIRGKFFEHSSATIGASFLMKTLTCGNVVNTMKIWDTAGQDAFLPMTSVYYKDVDGAILVFDASKPDTMDSLDNWLCDLQQNNVGRQFSLFLVCNKIDLNRGIDREHVQQYADKIGAPVFYTSAKDGTGVNDLFTEMSNSIIKRHNETANFAVQNYGVSINDSIKVPLTENPPEDKKKCCC